MKIFSQNIFVPAAAVTGAVPAAGGGVVALPAVDSGNVSLLVTNNGAGPAWIILQTVTQNLSDPGNGAVQINPGGSILYAPSGPADYPNTISATATYASVKTPSGGTLTFTRGTVTTQTVVETQ